MAERSQLKPTATESEEDLRPVKRRGLRTGYTTGACAAAAAKAATQALLTGRAPAEVTIDLPIGRTATFALHRVELRDGAVLCSIIKDAGDDPDVTHLAEIQATVVWADEPGITLAGGVGVGRVTKPGLGLAVGEPAINPVPRRMIHESVAQALDESGANVQGSTFKVQGSASEPEPGSAAPDFGTRNQVPETRDQKPETRNQELETRNQELETGNSRLGLRVTISVPKGEELAKKTLNGRLGILGGISILGTTGIVQPYSTASWRASVLQAIDVAAANGVSEIVLSTGGRSERFAAKIVDLPEIAFVEMGEFTGQALKQAVKRHLKKVYLAGMVGKFSKIAQGHFMTHVAGNQVDPHYLAQLAYECGASAEFRDELRGANTARHFQELILERGGPRSVFDRICAEVCARGFDLVKGRLTLEAFLFDFDGSVLGHARSPVVGAVR